MIFGESRVLHSNVAYLTFVLIDIDGCFRGRWTSVDGDTGISESVEYPKVKVVMHAPVVTFLKKCASQRQQLLCVKKECHTDDEVDENLSNERKINSPR